VQCAYWVNTTIAQWLTKGTLVELQGSVDVNAYKSIEGEAKASLTFHVKSIKLHGKASTKDEVRVNENVATILEPANDLPF
jgi:single-strand DNA-binding protein